MTHTHDTLHASLVAMRVGGDWRGVLIEGPSGSGKSDLALRCLAAGFSLVADDRVIVFKRSNAVWGHAPAPLLGLIESRGVGVLAVTALGFSRIDLCVDLAVSPGDVERLPEGALRTLFDHAIPAARIWPFAAGAPAQIAAMLRRGNGSP